MMCFHLKIIGPLNHVFLRHRVKNYHRSKLLTYNEELTLIKLLHPVIRASREVICQVKITKSPQSHCLWSPYLSGWWYTTSSSHPLSASPFNHVILWDQIAEGIPCWPLLHRPKLRPAPSMPAFICVIFQMFTVKLSSKNIITPALLTPYDEK